MATFLLTSCASIGDQTGPAGAPEEIRDLDRPTSVSRVAWTWEAPEGVADLAGVHAVPGGVAAVVDDGVIGLSGENGGVMWEHRVPGSEVFGAVAGQGRYFVLQVLDSDDTEAPPRMVVIDLSTGESVHDYELRDGDSASGLVRGGLGSVTGEHWITVEDDENLVAHELGSDATAWSVPDVAGCDDVGSVDRTAATDDVLVAAFTCYEQPEGEDPVEMTEGQEFVSGFAGFDPATGDELWRTEASAGMFPADAHERDLTVHESGLATAYYPYDQGGQVIDPATGDVEALDGGEVLWSSEDGSLLGVWDGSTRGYRIQELGGDVRASLGDERVGAGTAIVNALQGDIETVGLEGGLLHMGDLFEGGTGETELAAFEGFEETVPVTFSWEAEASMELDQTVAVPGAVAVSYIDHSGSSGVMGLQ
ncbi:PQQ-binding-like beta-propeller repeat protein [Nocardiopsis sp. NPDC058631]|uniref:outer membrane protein assembly factor BamB family protein n=1 Tax=Nocardiopsis sp. NPDC058631 TaxID=3346566 RepID=UPI00364CC8FC